MGEYLDLVCRVYSQHMWSLHYHPSVFLVAATAVPLRVADSNELASWIRENMSAKQTGQWEKPLESDEKLLSRTKPSPEMKSFHQWFTRALRAQILGVGSLRVGNTRNAQKWWNKGRKCLTWAVEALREVDGSRFEESDFVNQIEKVLSREAAQERLWSLGEVLARSRAQ